MKKLAPLAVIIAILGFVVVALNKKPSAPTTAYQHNHDNHTHHDNGHDKSLIVVTPWEITSQDPSKSGFVFQRLGLVETLVDANNDGNLVPALATEWVANDVANEWVFKLRQGVKFHDGTPLLAKDVIHSLTIALKKPTALEQANIERIEKIDEHTVKFVLKKPLTAFPAFLAHSTAVILAESSFDKDGNVVQLVGTGAYKADKIEPPQKIEQSSFADYWGNKAKINKIQYLANSRSETRALMAQSADNYLVYNLDGASLDKLRADDNLVVKSMPIARTIQYKVNAKNPIFADVKIRQILSRAIDRQGISQAVFKTDNAAAYQLLPAMFADWQIDTKNEKPNYDALKDELKALGYSYNASDELLDKHGKPIKFTLKTFSDRPELPIVATALQNQWKQIGITVDVAIGNFSDIPLSHQNGSLEMALYARNYGLIPDPLGALAEDFNEKGSDWGVMNWQNAELTAKFAQLNASKDVGEHKALKQEISRIIDAEQPITPVLYYQQQVAYNKKLQGVQLDALERKFGLNAMGW